MIIFGTRSKILTGSGAKANCHNCGSTQTVSLVFAVKYFHIFWIPMFPYSKVGASQCSHCKQVLYNNEMPDGLKTVYEQEKSQAKTPWVYRTGLILIGLFMAFVIGVIVFGGASKADIKTPIVNDVYQVKDGNRNYALYKVIAVNGDTVTVVKHNEVARKASQLDQLMKNEADNYSKNETKFTKSELEQMISDRKLIDVEKAEK